MATIDRMTVNGSDYDIMDAKSRADMTALSQSLTLTVSKNLIGPDPNVLYPVELHANDVITMSSSDDSVGTVYRFRTYDANGNRTHYWDIPGAQATPYRVLTMPDDVHYISWEHVITAEFNGIPQCERGNVKTDFVPWVGNSKYFLDTTTELNAFMDDAEPRVLNVGKNLIGGEKWVYYPASLNAGDIITFSAQEPIPKYSEIYFHDANFAQIEYWAMQPGTTQRTVTIAHDGICYICLHSDNLTIAGGVYLQIERGDHATTYEPYRDTSRAVRDAILKGDELKRRYKTYDFLQNASQYRKGVANSSWHDRFVLFHMSDNHIGTQFAQKNLAELGNVVNEAGFDAIVNSGDMTNAGGASYSRDKTISEFSIVTNELTNRVTIPVLATLGNHDANDVSDELIANASTKYDQWTAVFEPIAQKFSSIVWGDASHYKHYHYLDIAKGGYILRIITLDSLDHADYIPGDQSYVGHATEVYSQEQMDWLCNVALNVPSDNYGVIINNHFPFAPDRANYSEEWAALKDGTFAQGWEMIPKIVRAWVNRGSLSETFTDTKLGINNITINANFSAVPSGALFVCFMTGHTHSKNVFTVKQEGGTNYGQLMLCEDSSGQQGSALNKVYKYDNGIQNTAASQVAIDMAERKIYRTAYGAFQHSSEEIMKCTEIFAF